MTHPVSQSQSPDIADISARLRSARLSATTLADFPGIIPTTHEQAYAVQNLSIDKWPDTLVGFKVGGIPPHFRDQFGANWLAGPVFSRNVYSITDGETADVEVFPGGFAAYEAEWVFTLANIDWSRTEPFSLEDAKAAISSVNIGTEIASSPMPMVNDLGPGSIISDFGNNSSVWIGPAADLSVLDRLDEATVSVDIDGQRIGTATTNPGENGPLGAVRFLLNHLQTRQDQIELPEKILVSSGAVTGVHSAAIGSTGLMTFEGLGRFGLNMIPKKAEPSVV